MPAAALWLCWADIPPFTVLALTNLPAISFLLCSLFFSLVYISVQPIFEAIFKRLFPQRTPAIMVAEMPNGQNIAVPANDESVEMMQCTSESPTFVSEDDVEFAEDSTINEFEVVESYEDID